MNVGHLQASRPQYYDRNATVRAAAYRQDAVAPHARTLRLSLTVATGKKAYLEGANLFEYRDTVATVGGRAELQMEYVDGTPTTFVLAHTAIRLVTLGSNDRNTPSTYGLLAAGEIVRVYSEDSNTDGTVAYSAAVKIAQFDA